MNAFAQSGFAPVGLGKCAFGSPVNSGGVSSLTTFTVNSAAKTNGDTINLANGVTSATIAATNSGSISLLAGNTGLPEGSVQDCTFRVTAQDGVTTLDVTLHLRRWAIGTAGVSNSGNDTTGTVDDPTLLFATLGAAQAALAIAYPTSPTTIILFNSTADNLVSAEVSLAAGLKLIANTDPVSMGTIDSDNTISATLTLDAVTLTALQFTPSSGKSHTLTALRSSTITAIVGRGADGADGSAGGDASPGTGFDGTAGADGDPPTNGTDGDSVSADGGVGMDGGSGGNAPTWAINGPLAITNAYDGSGGNGGQGGQGGAASTAVGGNGGNGGNSTATVFQVGGNGGNGGSAYASGGFGGNGGNGGNGAVITLATTADGTPTLGATSLVAGNFGVAGGGVGAGSATAGGGGIGGTGAVGGSDGASGANGTAVANTGNDGADGTPGTDGSIIGP